MKMSIGAEAFQRARQSDPAGERLRRRSKSAFRLIGLLVIGLLGLAAILQVGGAVIGNGQISVESSVKTIAHGTGGVLKEVLVRDGDQVKPGQLLMRLDTTVTAVGAETASLGLRQLLARRARLEAERDGAGIVFPPQLLASHDASTLEAIARESRVFQLKQREAAGVIALLRQRQQQYRDQIESYRAQISAIDGQLSLIDPEREGLRKLHERQLVTINRLNEIERAAMQLGGSRAALRSSIAEAQARISETAEQILNVDKQRRSDAATQLAEVLGQVNEQTVRAASTIDANIRSEIAAPLAGTIDKLAFTTIGSAVPANQPLMRIVPDGEGLIVEARVRPQDVDQVKVGQKARVTLSGLNRQSTPDMPGSVIFVAPELTADEHSGQSFYRIKVRLDAKALAAAPGVELKAGMPAEVFIETGSRSILSFIFKPLFDQIRYAMRADG